MSILIKPERKQWTIQAKWSIVEAYVGSAQGTASAVLGTSCIRHTRAMVLRAVLVLIRCIRH